MTFNQSEKWLREKAAAEDGCYVSAGPVDGDPANVGQVLDLSEYFPFEEMLRAPALFPERLYFVEVARRRCVVMARSEDDARRQVSDAFVQVWL